MNDVIGIDIDNDYAFVSYLKNGMDKPKTISPIAASEKYAIKVELARDAKKGEWLVGKKLMEKKDDKDLMYKRDLLYKAYEEEDGDQEKKTYKQLGIFFGYLMSLAQQSGVNKHEAAVVITIDSITETRAKALKRALYEAGVKDSQIYMVDHKESFYFFLSNQSYERFMHDVVLYKYSNGVMREIYFSRDNSKKPALVSLEEKRIAQIAPYMDDVTKDVEFEKYLAEAFEGKKISTVYVVGEGFESDWMKNSLKVLCNRRKVFSGKNLFTMGACCYPFEGQKGNLLYIGNSMMQCDFTMDIRVGGADDSISMINVGDNLYKSFCAFDVIIDDQPFITVKTKRIISNEEYENVLELNDLVERPSMATRLHITAEPVDPFHIKVSVSDLGLGELYLSSGMSWEFIVGDKK